MMAGVISDELIAEICTDEGFVANPYICPTGYRTIGYGTRLPLSTTEAVRFDLPQDPAKLTKKQAELLLRSRLWKMWMVVCQKSYPALGVVVEELSRPAQEVLVNMCYNLGANGLLNFKRMWAALAQRDYAEASREMLDSKWAKQVGKRAYRLANKMQGAG